MENHHTNTFYSNFAKLLRICEDLDIYKLPKNYNLFTPKNLQRYDSIINHNACAIEEYQRDGLLG